MKLLVLRRDHSAKTIKQTWEHTIHLSNIFPWSITAMAIYGRFACPNGKEFRLQKACCGPNQTTDSISGIRAWMRRKWPNRRGQNEKLTSYIARVRNSHLDIISNLHSITKHKLRVASEPNSKWCTMKEAYSGNSRIKRQKGTCLTITIKKLLVRHAMSQKSGNQSSC